MKKEINKKIAEVTNYILGKEIKDITIDDYNILNAELTKIEFEENKEQREKDNGEMAQIMSKIFMNRS